MRGSDSAEARGPLPLCCARVESVAERSVRTEVDTWRPHHPLHDRGSVSARRSGSSSWLCCWWCSRRQFSISGERDGTSIDLRKLQIAEARLDHVRWKGRMNHGHTRPRHWRRDHGRGDGQGVASLLIAGPASTRSKRGWLPSLRAGGSCACRADRRATVPWSPSFLDRAIEVLAEPGYDAEQPDAPDKRRSSRMEARAGRSGGRSAVMSCSLGPTSSIGLSERSAE